MDELNKYIKVNRTESLQELAQVILDIADKDGMIQGRTRKLDAKRMSQACATFEPVFSNALTRKNGIRQQAFMLYHFKRNSI